MDTLTTEEDTTPPAPPTRQRTRKAAPVSCSLTDAVRGGVVHGYAEHERHGGDRRTLQPAIRAGRLVHTPEHHLTLAA